MLAGSCLFLVLKYRGLIKYWFHSPPSIPLQIEEVRARASKQVTCQHATWSHLGVQQWAEPWTQRFQWCGVICTFTFMAASVTTAGR